MKKIFFSAILGLATVFFAASCSKSDPNPTTTTTVEGKWVGNQNNGIGGPLYYLLLNFKTNGVLVVNANNAVTPDIANGTWSIVADSVRATYTYVGLSTTYSLAGKFIATSNVMNGTIGVGTSTTGTGVFSVTKE